MIPEDMKKSKAGGRPSNHSLLMSEDEFFWLEKEISKRLLSNQKGSPKVRKNLESLQDKMSIPVPATKPLEGLVLKLTRDELQVINVLVGNMVAALRDKVIPEYARRFPEGGPRTVEAMQKLVLLLELHNKGVRIYEAGSHRRGNARK